MVVVAFSAGVAAAGNASPRNAAAMRAKFPDKLLGFAMLFHVGGFLLLGCVLRTGSR